MVRGVAVLMGILAATAPAAQVRAAETAGSAAAGRELFDGSRPLRNGGAPCGACHAPGGTDLSRAATLGPELATGLASMDAPALDGLLETLPFPTMTPIYDGHPLTPAERADLAAYLLGAARDGAPPPSLRFERLALALAAIPFLALGLPGKRRKGSTRERLLARATRASGGSR